MVTVTKTFEFESAHHLPNYSGKCLQVHGHSYKLEVEVSGYQKPGETYPTMVVDFGTLKHYVQTLIIDKFDHADLNTYFKYPTAENMVASIAGVLNETFIVERVRLWETRTSYAEWRKK